jgi:hypothetical protein
MSHADIICCAFTEIWAQHAAPNKKGNVGRRKTGGAGRQSVVTAARLGTVVG